MGFHFCLCAWRSDGVFHGAHVVLLSLLYAFLGLKESQKTILLVFGPGSNVSVAIGESENSCAVLLEICHLALVDAAVLLNDFALGHYSLFELSFVQVSR